MLTLEFKKRRSIYTGKVETAFQDSSENWSPANKSLLVSHLCCLIMAKMSQRQEIAVPLRACGK